MSEVISAPSIRVNQETISIVPNTVKVVSGRGDIAVRSSSAGGRSVESVHGLNTETLIGSVTFSIYNTTDDLAKLDTWQANIGANTVNVIGTVRGVSRSYTFARMSVETDPEINVTADGTTEVTFKGDPAAIA